MFLNYYAENFFLSFQTCLHFNCNYTFATVSKKTRDFFYDKRGSELQFLFCTWIKKQKKLYSYVQVVSEYFTLHSLHLTVQHHTNLHLHLTSLYCSTVRYLRFQELQRDLHPSVDTVSLLHVLPSIPGEPAVVFHTQ